MHYRLADASVRLSRDFAASRSADWRSWDAAGPRGVRAPIHRGEPVSMTELLQRTQRTRWSSSTLGRPVSFCRATFPARFRCPVDELQRAAGRCRSARSMSRTAAVRTALRGSRRGASGEGQPGATCSWMDSRTGKPLVPVADGDAGSVGTLKAARHPTEEAADGQPCVMVDRTALEDRR